jgi:hypothetical protein
VTRGDLRELPFYRERLGSDGAPAAWDLEDLQAFAARTGDPFGGRLAPGARPSRSVEVVASEDEPVFVGLAPRELHAWSRALARTLAPLALAPGDTLALFDYGSSPLVLLASGAYTAYLGRGAADRLGVATICNDGLASLAGRMVEICARVRPAALVLRRDVLAPLDEELRTTGVELAKICRGALVTECEGAPPASELERYARAWDIPLHATLRADAALVLGVGDAGALWLDAALYDVETLADGELAVSTRFATTCPARRYRLGPGEASRAPARRPGGSFFRLQLA